MSCFVWFLFLPSTVAHFLIHFLAAIIDCPMKIMLDCSAFHYSYFLSQCDTVSVSDQDLQ